MFVGAESRNRTGTLSPARDFESRASTYSAISATHFAIMAELQPSGNSYVVSAMVMPASKAYHRVLEQIESHQNIKRNK